MLRLLLKLTLLLLAAVAAGALWQKYALGLDALVQTDPLPHTRELVNTDHYAEAAQYLGFFMHYDYVSANPQAQTLSRQIDEVRNSWGYQLKKVGEGLLTGTSDETLGLVAGVASDLFVIGDIRDLVGEGLHLAKGEEVDEVLVALASIGVVASAAQAASSAGTVASAGAAAPAVVATTSTKTELATVKAAHKLGMLPKWLGNALLDSARAARESRSIASLAGLAGDVSTLAHTPGGLRLLKQTSNADNLSHMARFARTFGDNSVVLYRLVGNSAQELTRLAALHGQQAVELAATFGQNGLRMLDQLGALRFTLIVSRTSKMAWKGNLMDLLAHLAMQVPQWLLLLLSLLGVLVWIPSRLLVRAG